MVRVKTPTGWKTVKSGTDITGAGRGKVSFTTPTKKSSGGSSGSSLGSVGGYEVIRDGQGVSTQVIQAGDLPIKTIIRSGGSRRVAPAIVGAEVMRNGEMVSTQKLQAGDLPITPTTRRIAPPKQSVDIRQQKYIRSLSTSPDSNLVVSSYGGIQLPYGQRDMTWREPQFGTVTEDAPSGFKEVSLYGELRKKEIIMPEAFMPEEVIVQRTVEKISNKIKKDLGEKYQEKVDKGELTVEQAEKQYQAEAEEKFNTEWGKASSSGKLAEKLKESKKQRGTFEKAFSPEYKAKQKLKAVEFVADTGAIVASAVVPAVGIGYFVGKGVYQASKGAKEDIRMAEFSPSGELKVAQYPGLIPSEYSKKAGESFLFAGISAVGAVGKIGADITATRRAELAAKPWETTTEELFKSGDKTFLRVKGFKGTPGAVASAEGEAIFPVEVLKGGKFKVLSGRGHVDTQVIDFMKEGVSSYKDSIIKSSLDYGLYGRGVIKKGAYRLPGGYVPFEKTKVFATTGEGFVLPDSFQGVKATYKEVPSKFWTRFTRDSGFKIYKPTVQVDATFIGDKTTGFTFGGLSRKEGEKVFYKSGRFVKARLYKADWGMTGIMKPEAIGSTLVKDAGAKSAFKSFPGGGAKSSKEFIKSLYEPAVATIKKEVPKTSQVLIPKAAVIPKASLVKTNIIGQQFAGKTFNIAEGIASAAVKSGRTFIPQAAMLSAVAITPLITAKPKIKIKTDYKIKTDTLSAQAIALASNVDSATDIMQDTFSGVSRQPKQKQIVETIVSPITIPFTPTPITPRGKGIGDLGDFGFGWKSSVALIRVKKKKQAFIPQAKSKGKWKSLSKKPMTRQAALGRMSRTMDNTLSAQGRIKPVKGTPSKLRDNYFSKSKNKLRPYKIRKGVAIGMHNQFIEKSGSRIDTLGEKRGLRVSQFAKQNQWLVGTKKKKKDTKTKSPWLI